MIKYSLLLLTLGTILWGCDTAEKTPDTETPETLQPEPEKKSLETVKTEVEAMLHQYHGDLGERGMMAEFEYLDSSEQFFWRPPDRKSHIDFDSVKTLITQASKNMKSVHFNWDTLKVIPLSDEIATYSGIISSEMVTRDDQKIEAQMIETGTVIWRDSSWKLINGHASHLPE